MGGIVVDEKRRPVDVSDEAIKKWLANAEDNIKILKETFDKAQTLGMKVAVIGPAPGRGATATDS